MFKKVGKILLTIILGFLLFIIGKFLFTWDTIDVDTNLSKNGIFKSFDKQKQATLWDTESENIKTNNFKVKTDSLSGEYYSCYIDKNPILNVRFSVGDGFSGGGYQIDIIQNRYKISLYSYTDNIKPFDFLDKGPDYKVLDSKLILDKESYKKDDSIFGYSELKIERKLYPGKEIQIGKGYFKGIVN